MSTLVKPDKKQMLRSFNASAASYDQVAVVQRAVLKKLLSKLNSKNLNPSLVLDLGAGTGAAVLSDEFKTAHIIEMDIAINMLKYSQQQNRADQSYLCADAERIPLADQSVDIVFSSLMLQWCDIKTAFAEIKRILRPGGLFTFSSLGPQTLKELRQSWAAVDEHTHVNHFSCHEEIEKSLLTTGFEDVFLEQEGFRLFFNDALSVMRDLKQLGAHNVNTGRCKGLTGKQRLQKMIAAYEQYRHNDKLPVTYDVIFASAKVYEEGTEQFIEAGQVR